MHIAICYQSWLHDGSQGADQPAEHHRSGLHPLIDLAPGQVSMDFRQAVQRFGQMCHGNILEDAHTLQEKVESVKGIM